MLLENLKSRNKIYTPYNDLNVLLVMISYNKGKGTYLISYSFNLP